MKLQAKTGICQKNDRKFVILQPQTGTVRLSKYETIPNGPYNCGFSQVQSLLGMLRCLPQAGIWENQCAQARYS